VRVRARDTADARRAWRAAQAAIDVPAQLYVDTGRDGRPVLGGSLRGSPERALALLREPEPGSEQRYVATDGSYASVRVQDPRDARAKVQRARTAGIERLSVSWRAGTDPSWFDAAGIDRDATTLEDDPATVLKLLGAAERARRRL
jgi:hypothetical protein